jgi:hypothetical protein
MKYSVKLNEQAEGSFCEFYDIVEDSSLGFKSFSKKNRAINALSNQKKLSKFGLAPKAIGDIIKLPFFIGGMKFTTNWGFITQKAQPLDEDYSEKGLEQIQKLVNHIYVKTNLKFWDCSWWNVGLVKMKGKQKMVCIDTGSESFSVEGNAWGFNFPGPKCDICDQYECYCDV